MTVKYQIYETHNPYKPRKPKPEPEEEEEKMEPVVPYGWKASKPDRPISKRPAAWVGTVGLHHSLVAVADKADSGSTAWKVAGALAIVAGAVALLFLY